MMLKTCAFALGIAAIALAADPPLDKATLDRWMQELSNWGRWGKDDQMGTVNLITPAKRKAAAALVKEGYSVSLSSDAETVKSADNEFPFGHEMIATGTDSNPMFGMDIYSTRYHGKVLTHLDALSHMFYQGKMYNGYSQQQVNRQGAQQLAVTAYKNGLISRGILMDIPRSEGRQIPGPFDADLPGRSGRVGEEGGHQGGFGRHRFHPDRSMGAARGEGPLGHRGGGGGHARDRARDGSTSGTWRWWEAIRTVN